MYIKDDLRDQLEFIHNKAYDILSCFEEYRDDDYLEGVLFQTRFMIDLLENVDLLVYGYHRYVHDVQEGSASDSRDFKEGRLSVVDVAHLIIDVDVLFDDYPSNDEIQEVVMCNRYEQCCEERSYLSV